MSSDLTYGWTRSGSNNKVASVILRLNLYLVRFSVMGTLKKTELLFQASVFRGIL